MKAMTRQAVRLIITLPPLDRAVKMPHMNQDCPVPVMGNDRLHTKCTPRICMVDSTSYPDECKVLRRLMKSSKRTDMTWLGPVGVAVKKKVLPNYRNGRNFSLMEMNYSHVA